MEYNIIERERGNKNKSIKKGELEGRVMGGGGVHL